MAEETWPAARPIPTAAVNHYERIHSIVDAVFGPDDDSPVPTARTMTAAQAFTTCTGCGNDIPAAAFWLCGPCHQHSLDEAAQEARHS
jgi:hypothetical protein